jgi:hypothetical protein
MSAIEKVKRLLGEALVVLGQVDQGSARVMVLQSKITDALSVLENMEEGEADERRIRNLEGAVVIAKEYIDVLETRLGYHGDMKTPTKCLECGQNPEPPAEEPEKEGE